METGDGGPNPPLGWSDAASDQSPVVQIAPPTGFGSKTDQYTRRFIDDDAAHQHPLLGRHHDVRLPASLRSTSNLPPETLGPRNVNRRNGESRRALYLADDSLDPSARFTPPEHGA